ncbi:condensation domain-containing protein [Amycolatopsis nivea]
MTELAGQRAVPRTAHEETVAAIWREVLGRADFGAQDDFFDLAGTSLQAIEVVSRLRDEWGANVRARDFFAAPTIETLAAALADAAPPERPPIAPRPDGSAPVLSYDQQRLWLEHQLRPDTAYNVHGRRRLAGPLDVAALERSVRAVLARHESLRTRFPVEDGQAVQAIDPPDEDWRIGFEDVSAHEGDPLARARELADEQAARPFDLEHGPLLRCLLVRAGPEDHVLAVTAHHIVCDNWSIGLFIRELSQLYRAGGDPVRAGLAPLPVQYRDYAVWQRTWLTSDALAAQVHYWREQLAGAPASLRLPAASRRPSAPGGRGGRARTRLSPADSSAFAQLCRSCGVTSFMAVTAAFAALLVRWSGQDEVVVGVPVTGRTDPGVRQLIGFFVNTVPLRVDASDDPAFADLAGRVRRTALAGYAHADAPLDLLVTELRLPRDPGRTPVFQVLVNAVDGLGDEQLPGVVATELDAPVPPSKLDLALSVRQSGDQLALELDYNADRYSAALMEALLGQLAVLLRAVSDDPGREISGYVLDAG